MDLTLPKSKPTSPYVLPGIPDNLPQLPRSPWDSPTDGIRATELELPISRPDSPYFFLAPPAEPMILPGSPVRREVVFGLPTPEVSSLMGMDTKKLEMGRVPSIDTPPVSKAPSQVLEDMSSPAGSNTSSGPRRSRRQRKVIVEEEEEETVSEGVSLKDALTGNERALAKQQQPMVQLPQAEGIPVFLQQESELDSTQIFSLRGGELRVKKSRGLKDVKENFEMKEDAKRASLERKITDMSEEEGVKIDVGGGTEPRLVEKRHNLTGIPGVSISEDLTVPAEPTLEKDIYQQRSAAISDEVYTVSTKPLLTSQAKPITTTAQTEDTEQPSGLSATPDASAEINSPVQSITAIETITAREYYSSETTTDSSVTSSPSRPSTPTQEPAYRTVPQPSSPEETFLLAEHRESTTPSYSPPPQLRQELRELLDRNDFHQAAVKSVTAVLDLPSLDPRSIESENTTTRELPNGK